MRTSEEIAVYAKAVMHRATDELAEYVGEVPDDDRAAHQLFREAFKTVFPTDRKRMKRPTRQSLEAAGAHDLLVAVEHTVAPRDVLYDDFELEEDAWEALRNGDLVGARAACARILASAEQLGADDSSRGDLVHNAHIILGHVCADENDIPAAEAELRSAGAAPPTAVLKSFGPDLSLAFTLLKLGSEQAALDYFKQISTFWSPHTRRA